MRLTSLKMRVATSWQFCSEALVDSLNSLNTSLNVGSTLWQISPTAFKPKKVRQELMALPSIVTTILTRRPDKSNPVLWFHSSHELPEIELVFQGF
jgi:hypothetical protein